MLIVGQNFKRRNIERLSYELHGINPFLKLKEVSVFQLYYISGKSADKEKAPAQAGWSECRDEVREKLFYEAVCYLSGSIPLTYPVNAITFT